MRASSTLLLPLLLLATSAPAAVILAPGNAPPPSPPGWVVRTDITNESAQPKVGFKAFNPTTLQWVDVDRDGNPEILSPNTNRRFYLFAPNGSILAEEVWPSTNAFKPAEATQPGIVVGDVDFDGHRELYVLGNQGHLRKYEHDPANSTATKLALRFEWERCLLCTQGEHDGTPWAGAGLVFAQHDNAPEQRALKANGATKWSNTAHDGNAGVVAIDIDADGDRDVVFATDAGEVMARRAATGALTWLLDLREELGASPGSIPPQPTLRDLDGDGDKEVMVCVRHAPDDEARSARGYYAAVGADGGLVWSRQIEDGSPMCNMHGIALDFTKDGVKDVLWLDWNTMGHSPGGFERLGPAKMFVLNGTDGSIHWKVDVDTRWSDKDLAVCDGDGDGKNEILVPQDHDGTDGLSLYTLDGEEEWWWPAPAGWTVARGAVCARLDGRLHVLLSLTQPTQTEGVQSPDGTSPVGRLLLLDTSHTYKAGWSGQYIYAGN
jgi:outer membrane protein assembly factor BamB